jgi:FAD:protein FMN transferase
MKYQLLVIACWCITGLTQAAAQVNKTQRYAFQHPQMGTVFRLVFYAEKDSSEAGAIARKIFDKIDSLNAIFSDWIPESELNHLCNTAGSGKKVPVSASLFDILLQSKGFSKQSDGAFDASIGPLTRLWRRARSLKELPDQGRIAAAREKVGWKNIQTFRRKRCIRLQKAGMALDLGGIAHGWTADFCLKMLKNHGISRALVDAGGDIALGDAPPGDWGWAIAVPAGIADGDVLKLKNCGITTSGATARFIELDGKRYSHIIDPRTGQALNHRLLVTVLAPNATTADAWATAVSVSGEPGRVRARKSDKRLKVWLTEARW